MIITRLHLITLVFKKSLFSEAFPQRDQKKREKMTLYM